MLDDIGLGKFFANSIITAGMLFLIMLDVLLIYINEKKAKWILLSIIANIISAICFGAYAARLIVNINLIVWPFVNLIFVSQLCLKNIALYRSDKEKYKTSHKQSDLKKIVIKLILAVLLIWFLAVTWFFVRTMYLLFYVYR